MPSYFPLLIGVCRAKSLRLVGLEDAVSSVVGKVPETGELIPLLFCGLLVRHSVSQPVIKSSGIPTDSKFPYSGWLCRSQRILHCSPDKCILIRAVTHVTIPVVAR